MPAQEAVLAGVVGEELAVLIPSAVVLAGDVIGDKRLKVKCRSLAHTLVNTPGLGLGHGVPVRPAAWTPDYCQQDQGINAVVVHVSEVGY